MWSSSSHYVIHILYIQEALSTLLELMNVLLPLKNSIFTSARCTVVSLCQRELSKVKELIDTIIVNKQFLQS